MTSHTPETQTVVTEAQVALGAVGLAALGTSFVTPNAKVERSSRTLRGARATASSAQVGGVRLPMIEVRTCIFTNILEHIGVKGIKQLHDVSMISVFA